MFFRVCGKVLGSIDPTKSKLSEWALSLVLRCLRPKFKRSFLHRSTLPNGPGSLDRLQFDNTGGINMVPTSFTGSWESFKFTEVESDSIVTIRKRNATGFGLDGGNGFANGQNVYLWTHNPNNVNQQWEEIDRGGGYYSYQKAGTNHSIDGGNGGASGQNVYLWATNANNQNQQWRKVSVGGGAYQLVKRNAPYAMNGGGGGANGQNVNLYSSSATSQNLQWFVE